MLLIVKIIIKVAIIKSPGLYLPKDRDQKQKIKHQGYTGLAPFLKTTPYEAMVSFGCYCSSYAYPLERRALYCSAPITWCLQAPYSSSAWPPGYAYNRKQNPNYRSDASPCQTGFTAGHRLRESGYVYYSYTRCDYIKPL